MKRADRRVCAVLFTDIVNSTGLKEQLGEERFDQIRNDYKHECVRLSHKGEVIKDTGDGLLITFDRPADAVESAMAMRDGTGVALHFGIDFGEVIADAHDVHGSVADRAARINSLAGPGRILVSDAVFRSAQGFANHRTVSWLDCGEHELRGVTVPVRVWECYNANIVPGTRMNQSQRPLVTAIEGVLFVLVIMALLGVWTVQMKVERLAGTVEARVTESNQVLSRIENMLKRP